MKHGTTAYLFLGALVMAGCRGGVGAPDGPDEALDDGSAPDPAVDPADVEPLSGGPDEEPKKGTYIQDIAKLEAGRAGAGEALAQALSKLALQGLLLELVEDLAAVGPSGSFKKAAGINKKMLARMKETRKGTGDDVLDLLNNVARRNLEAYGSCMAVAKGDPAWCDGLEKTWEGAGASCGAIYDLHVLVMGKAFIKNQPCSKAMAGARSLEGEVGVKFCEAVIRQDEDACPADDSEPLGAYCAAAARKGNIRACSKVKIGWGDKQKRCCEIFAWRMSWMPAGSSEVEIPEAGALKGDEAGCMNALRWGLFESLAPVFEVPLEGEHPAAGELYGEFLCPVLVYWTQREMTL